MVKPTLLVLAAGMGSRYGSLKQMDGVGPNNEAIIDYSVYDAIRAGFGKVVFVIRHSFEKEFREVFSAERFGGRIAVEFVFQELDYLPEGASVPEGRVKPWGTNHAVMMAADAVHEPFAVINADDFYGAEAYQTIGDYLSQLGDSKNRYCMVAYDLNRTLSDNGTVSRGVCGVDADGNLTSMVERTQIERMPDGRILFHDGGADEELAEDTPVSMNLFGFTPDFFAYSKEARREPREPQIGVLHPDDGQQTHRRGRGVPARAPFGGPVARRHLQGGQTRADGLDREDDRRGQIPPQSLGLVPGVIIRGGPKAAPYLLPRIVLLFFRLPAPFRSGRVEQGLCIFHP